MRATPAGALSGREIEVLTAGAHGLSNTDVARRLHISVATVKTHLLHIYTKPLGSGARHHPPRALTRPY